MPQGLELKIDLPEKAE